jgi:hypothetical protein
MASNCSNAITTGAAKECGLPGGWAAGSEISITPFDCPRDKTVKNRLHLDVQVSGGRAVPIETRRQRVDAEARRLADLGATMVGVLSEEGIDHYGVTMQDPEGNEFDIN